MTLYSKKKLIIAISTIIGLSHAGPFKLSGVVNNKTGGGIPFVDVVLKGPHLKDSLKTSTNGNGQWSISGVAPNLQLNAQWKYHLTGNQLSLHNSNLNSAQVINTQGQIILNIKSQKQNENSIFDLNQLPLGMSYIKVISEHEQMVFKYLKTHSANQIAPINYTQRTTAAVVDTLQYVKDGQLIYSYILSDLYNNSNNQSLTVDVKNIFGTLDKNTIPKSTISAEINSSFIGQKVMAPLTYGTNQLSYSGYLYTPYYVYGYSNNYNVQVMVKDSLGKILNTSPIVGVTSDQPSVQIDFSKSNTLPTLKASAPLEVSVNDTITIQTPSYDTLGGTIIVKQIKINNGNWIDFNSDSYTTIASKSAQTIPWSVRIMDNDSNWVSQSGNVAVVIGAPTGSITGPTSITANSIYIYSANVNPNYGKIVKYEWDLGTGQFQVGGSSINFSSTSSGTEFIQLRVTDDDGNQAVFYTYISVGKPTTYTEDLSLPHTDLTTTDGMGRWIPDADKAILTEQGNASTDIFDEDGKQSYYPNCATIGIDCNPIKNGYIYGKIVIKDYIIGRTGWGQWAGGGLLLDPTITSNYEPGVGSGIPPIGLNSNSVITIDMDASISGGSSKSGNTLIKFRLSEGQYLCQNDGSCMFKKMLAQSGRATYTLNVKDFKKNNWIYTDAGMKANGRNVDNYNDVYRLEIRSDAEPQTMSTDPCVASTATFKIYKVTITNLTP